MPMLRMMPYGLVAALAVCPHSMSAATERPSVNYPVSIPSECVPLAEREHAPLIIQSKAEGLKYRAKLYTFSPRDPMANNCRAAVHRIEAEMKAANKVSPN